MLRDEEEGSERLQMTAKMDFGTERNIRIRKNKWKQKVGPARIEY